MGGHLRNQAVQIPARDSSEQSGPVLRKEEREVGLSEVAAFEDRSSLLVSSYEF
jgi:hypothetical protein